MFGLIFREKTSEATPSVLTDSCPLRGDPAACPAPPSAGPPSCRLPPRSPLAVTCLLCRLDQCNLLCEAVLVPQRYVSHLLTWGPLRPGMTSGRQGLPHLCSLVLDTSLYRAACFQVNDKMSQRAESDKKR